MNSPPEPDDHELILNVFTGRRTLAFIRDALDRIARQSSDRQLKIYLAPVRSVLASARGLVGARRLVTLLIQR